jgi:pentatricopeptide repeat protein
MITAYGNGGQWELALELLLQLQQAGLAPDLVTYGTLIETMQRAGQVPIADEFYRLLSVKGSLHIGIHARCTHLTFMGSTAVWYWQLCD